MNRSGIDERKNAVRNQVIQRSRRELQMPWHKKTITNLNA